MMVWIDPEADLRRCESAPTSHKHRSSAGATRPGTREQGMGRHVDMDSPQAAVVQALLRPRQEPRVVKRSAGGWVTRLGGHVPARRETIRFRKERIAANVGLLAVEFEDEDGQRHFGVRGVVRQADGAWRGTTTIREFWAICRVDGRLHGAVRRAGPLVFGTRPW